MTIGKWIGGGGGWQISMLPNSFHLILLLSKRIIIEEYLAETKMLPTRPTILLPWLLKSQCSWLIGVS